MLLCRANVGDDVALVHAQWREMISDSTQKIGRPRQLYTVSTLADPCYR